MYLTHVCSLITRYSAEGVYLKNGYDHKNAIKVVPLMFHFIGDNQELNEAVAIACAPRTK